MRTIQGRRVYQKLRTCPVTKLEFTALIECDAEPVLGPERYETKQLPYGETGFRTLPKEVICHGVPGQRWEESPAQTFERHANQLPLVNWDPWAPPRDGIAAEAMRFAEQWPKLGAELIRRFKIELPRPPEGLIDPGRCGASRTLGTAYGQYIDPMPYLLRFIAGDLGDAGDIRELRLDEEQSWAPQVFGAAVEARHAIDTGHGLVRAAYRVEGIREAALKFMCCICPDREPRTIIWTGRDRVT